MPANQKTANSFRKSFGGAAAASDASSPGTNPVGPDETDAAGSTLGQNINDSIKRRLNKMKNKTPDKAGTKPVAMNASDGGPEEVDEDDKDKLGSPPTSGAY